MNIKFTRKDIVVGVVAAVIGAAISSTMMPSDAGYASIRRLESGTVNRDVDSQLREQDRRNDRLQEIQDEDELHGAAAEDIAIEALSYIRSRYLCRKQGIRPDSARFVSCIEAFMQTGEYNTDY